MQYTIAVWFKTAYHPPPPPPPPCANIRSQSNCTCPRCSWHAPAAGGAEGAPGAGSCADPPPPPQRPAPHVYSTLFVAQDIAKLLPTPAAVASAIDFCKNTSITKVYLETYPLSSSTRDRPSMLHIII